MPQLLRIMTIEPTTSLSQITYMTSQMTSEGDQTQSETDYVYEDYIYSSYPFERPVYLYVFSILVIFTCIINIIFISILLRKEMRNATNVVLTAIAVSESLTGLITLPAYIMVYQRLEETTTYEEYPSNELPGFEVIDKTSSNDSYPLTDMFSDSSNSIIDMDVYDLSKELCQWFMISKFILSKSFHTMSIFLTLCLGIQRYVSVASPFRARALTTRKALVTCILIAVLSPLLHIYHFIDQKAKNGLCEWTLEMDGCKGGCVYLWVIFFFRQLIPCTVLSILTILFIRELRQGNTNRQTERRVLENRRIVVIVTAIVIVFLISEVPYGFFLLYNAIEIAVNDSKLIDLKRNREIHLAYEILLVLLFQANFFIYTSFNGKFRTCLKKMFIQPFRGIMGRPNQSQSHEQTTIELNNDTHN